jgi:Domain of unknown function (DUF6950)
MTLEQYIASCSHRFFSWGCWDCCLFAADAVRCLTRRDPAARLRALYANEKEAVILINHLGGISEVVKSCGLHPVGPPYQNGDIGIMKSHLPVLLVFWQGRFLGVTKPHGLYPVHTRRVREVFRI